MKTHFLPAATAIALSASLLAQNWTQLPGSGPAPRTFPGLAYNWTSSSTLLFGGYDFVTTFNDTWELSGGTWTQLSPATVPTDRDSQAMAYDVARNRTVMFGGWDSLGNPLGDTWEWNGTDWMQMAPTTAPSPRINAGMVFDNARGVCVMFGGYEPNTGVSYTQTWEWDGTTWTLKSGLGVQPARDSFGMAFDTNRGRTVLFGGWDNAGNPLGDTWEYDGTNWMQVTTANAPAPRYFTSMAFDTSRNRCVLYGGEDGTSIFGDTWEYDGTNWTQSGAAGPTNALESMTLAYDIANARTLLVGGNDLNGTAYGDTWEYSGAAAASYTTFGSGCPGSNGVPALAAAGVPSLGSSFSVDITNLPPGGGLAYMVLGFNNTMWNGQPLPVNLAPFGFGMACNALVSVDDGAVVINNAGTATWTITIPNSPAFAGFDFYNQGASFDAGATGGLAFSDGAHGVIN